jgi:hypothetical protein
VSGYIILIGYLVFDSFTSNWQAELFNTYGMNSVQMMCGVNLMSCVLTSVSLLQQGGFFHSVAFMYDVRGRMDSSLDREQSERVNGSWSCEFSVPSFRVTLPRAVNLLCDWAVVYLLHDLAIRTRYLRDHHDRAAGLFLELQTTDTNVP